MASYQCHENVRRVRARCVFAFSSSPLPLFSPFLALKLLVFVANKLLFAEHAVNDRNEKERGECRENQTANDSAAERRVLLAAFAKTKRERQHTDDHGQRSHHYRTQPGKTGGERGVVRIFRVLAATFVVSKT